MDKREMTTLLYDMLKQNGQYTRIDLNEVKEVRLDLDDSVITFGYEGQSYKLEVERI